MIEGSIKNNNHIFILQTQMQVGIFNGIIVNPVSLQNIKKVNIMIGIVIVGIDLIKDNNLTIHQMVK